MNQQRGSIYRLRRMVLGFGAGIPVVEYDEDPKTRRRRAASRSSSWTDQREHVLDLVEDLVVDMVGATAARTASSDVGPRRALGDGEGAVRHRDEVRAAGRQGRRRSRAAIEEQVYNVVEKATAAKEEELGADADGVPVLRRYEQYLYLQAIDQQWKDHLLSMDHLRQGIGLRGYGQKDPKQEYKKEGYEMFVQMTWRVKSAVVGNILRLQLVRQESAEEIEQKRSPLQRRALQRDHARATREAGGGRRRERRARSRRRSSARSPKVGPERPVPVRLGQEVQEVPRRDRGDGVARRPRTRPTSRAPSAPPPPRSRGRGIDSNRRTAPRVRHCAAFLGGPRAREDRNPRPTSLAGGARALPLRGRVPAAHDWHARHDRTPGRGPGDRRRGCGD